MLDIYRLILNVCFISFSFNLFLIVVIRIGASGWSYREWYSVFYPKGLSSSDMLSYYARFFDTSEVNSSFYSIPRKDTIYFWSKKTPENFVFAIKVYKGITHEKKLSNVQRDLLEFVGKFEALERSKKLGPFLIQLPPRFKKNLKLLEGIASFLSTCREKYGYKFAIEFRHRSWIVSSTFNLLDKYKIAYVIVDEPLLPSIVRVTADFAYIRWHGRGRRIWYDYKYSLEELKKWVPKVREAESSAKIVYGYFNNHFHGHAIKDALIMKELLGIRAPSMPSLF